MASSAIYLSKKLLKLSNPWNEAMENTTGYTEKLLSVCARDLCYLASLASEKIHY